MKGLLPGIEADSDFDKDNLVSFGKQTKNIFHLWLISEIGEPRCFMKWFDVLQSASEDDIVVIHVNSMGGQLNTALQIISQIKMCQAQVLCQIEAECCSAATMIALACDGLYCNPHGFMMIHTSSGCSIGKQSDIKREEDFFNNWLSEFFNEIYKHFLTKKEIQSVLEGTDMWLTSTEIMERFKKRVGIVNRENNKVKREHMKKINSFMSKLQDSNNVEDGGAGEGQGDGSKSEEKGDDKEKAKDGKSKDGKSKDGKKSEGSENNGESSSSSSKSKNKGGKNKKPSNKKTSK